MWTPLGVANHTAAWRPEPIERGSWGVLSSCLATIGLCVWTAIHLNIPEHGQTSKHFGRKVKWVVLGLFAPEIICFIAFEQWRRQRKLHYQITKHLHQDLPATSKKGWSEKIRRWWRGHKKDPPGAVPATFSPESTKSEAPPVDTTRGQRNIGRKYPWTQLHSFYALIGGFAFDNSGRQNLYPLPDGRTRVTLSPQGLLFLAEFRPDLIPDIPESSIRDKSKSEGIAKVVAFWQALWFFAQFITRVSQGLHVSLLELNTILHVICASVAYFIFWFHKPLDIMESTPISVDNDETASICAAMTAVSTIGAWIPDLGISATYRAFAALDVDKGRVNARAQGVIDLINSAALETGEYALERPLHFDLDRLKVSDMPVVQQPAISISQLPDACIIHYTREKFGKLWYPIFLDSFKGIIRSISSGGWSNARNGEVDEWEANDEDFEEDVTINIENTDLRRQYQAVQGFATYSRLCHPRIEDLVFKRASNFGFVFDNGSTLGTLFATIVSEVSGLLVSDHEGDQRSHRARFREAASRFLHSSWVSSVGFLFASMLYGGTHLLLGWNGPMNTEIEVLLWRMSGFALFGPWAFILALILFLVAIIILFFLVFFSLVIVGALIMFPVFLFYPFHSCVCRSQSHKLMDAYGDMFGDVVSSLLFLGFYILLLICVLAFSVAAVGIALIFLLSRFYLVVESLVSLWYAPASVFVQPVWSAYVFHI